MAGIGRDEIESWLAVRVAEILRTTPADIDRHRSFSAYGIDSLTAAGLSGDLEDWLGRPVSATLLFDHETIAQAAAHLCEVSGDDD